MKKVWRWIKNLFKKNKHEQSKPEPVELPPVIKPNKKLHDWVFDFGEDISFNELRFYQWVFLDADDSRDGLIEALKKTGTKVYGYISVGSAEPFRSDYDQLKPYGVKKMKGWDETWIDITNHNVRSVMYKRVEALSKRGFEGFYCDNSDVSNHIDIPREKNLEYLKLIAGSADIWGLDFGINNGLEMLDDLKGTLDFCVNEQSVQYNEDHMYEPIVKLGKPIFHFEFNKKYAHQVKGHMLHVHRKESLNNKYLVERFGP